MMWLPFRPQLRAAPLKQRDAQAGQVGGRAIPPSIEGGPVEAPDRRSNNGSSIIPFRPQLRAAPLKPESVHISVDKIQSHSALN